jgi:hypothetical protein
MCESCINEIEVKLKDEDKEWHQKKKLMNCIGYTIS